MVAPENFSSSSRKTSHSTVAAILLIEFDSIEGPIIRMTRPMNFFLPKTTVLNDFLMWVIRAEDFSVRKIDELTAYAKALKLYDPNYSRKDRKFGFVYVCNPTIPLSDAETLLDDLIKKSIRRSNKQPYFKLLKGLIETLQEAKPRELFQLCQQTEKDLKEQVKESNKNKANNDKKSVMAGAIERKNGIISQSEANNVIKISTNRLHIFNRVIITDKLTEVSYIIGRPDTLKRPEEPVGKEFEITTGRIKVRVDLRGGIPTGLQKGLEILNQEIDGIPLGGLAKERLVVSVEFLDLLLWEQADIQFYTPYLRYILAMDYFTIKEFNQSQFQEHFQSLCNTHGRWIECLENEPLTGQTLEQYFQITGINRQAMEMLVDLIIIKIIKVYQD
jgi:hypothetical protein